METWRKVHLNTEARKSTNTEKVILTYGLHHRNHAITHLICVSRPATSLTILAYTEHYINGP